MEMPTEMTRWLLPGSGFEFKNPVAPADLRASPSLSYAFYSLSTCEFSTGRHSFAGRDCACAHILTLNLRIRVNQFVRSLYPRPPPPRKLNLLEGDFTFVTLSFNNAMYFLKSGPQSDATRGFPLLCFYDRAHRLTLTVIALGTTLHSARSHRDGTGTRRA